MKDQRSGEIELLLKIFDQAYDHAAWHGTNLRGSLRGLTPEVAAWRPGPGRHNIREIAMHAAYWKYAALRRLSGGKRGSFPLPGSNWFARLGTPTAEAWRRDLRLLEQYHQGLRRVIADFPPARLYEVRTGKKVTPAVLIYGAASHDLYHAGQIQLLKRLCRARKKA